MIPGLGRSPGEGNGNPLQYSCLENSIDRRAWRAGYSSWCHKELDTTEQLTNTYNKSYLQEYKKVNQSQIGGNKNCSKYMCDYNCFHISANLVSVPSPFIFADFSFEDCLRLFFNNKALLKHSHTYSYLHIICDGFTFQQQS